MGAFFVNAGWIVDEIKMGFEGAADLKIDDASHHTNDHRTPCLLSNCDTCWWPETFL
jgi:hypothetical protein